MPCVRLVKLVRHLQSEEGQRQLSQRKAPSEENLVEKRLRDVVRCNTQRDGGRGKKMDLGGKFPDLSNTA